MQHTQIIVIFATMLLQACDNYYEKNINIPEPPTKVSNSYDKQMQAIVNASGYDCSHLEGTYDHHDGTVTAKCTPATSTPTATYVLEFGMVKK